MIAALPLASSLHNPQPMRRGSPRPTTLRLVHGRPVPALMALSRPAEDVETIPVFRHGCLCVVHVELPARAGQHEMNALVDAAQWSLCPIHDREAA